MGTGSYARTRGIAHVEVRGQGVSSTVWVLETEVTSSGPTAGPVCPLSEPSYWLFTPPPDSTACFDSHSVPNISRLVAGPINVGEIFPGLNTRRVALLFPMGAGTPAPLLLSLSARVLRKLRPQIMTPSSNQQEV